MHSNTSQPFYPKLLHQNTQQQPLRSRAFSHLDNIPHQPAHHQSYNAHLSQDKVSEIKKKYDKSYTPNNGKPPKDNITSSGSTLSFGKNTGRYESHDENSTWSPYKEPTRHQRSITDQTGSSGHYGVPKMSYGRPSAKSELENGLSALNSMKNELKSKLNDLACKNQVSASQFLKDQFKEMRDSSLNTSYDLIVSKYSRTNGLSDNQTPQAIFSSKCRPEYVADKKMSHLETPSGSAFPYNYSFANKSTILERQTSKIDSLPNNEPKSTQYNFSKQNRIQRQSEDLNRKNAQKIGQSFIAPERYERRPAQDNKIPDQKTSLSYMNVQKDRSRQEQRNNFEFTLRKNEEVNKSYLKPADNPSHTQPLKYQLRTDNYSKYDIKNIKINTIKEQQPAKIPLSPYKGETRDSAVISRQIEKLDLKIRQIEQNKKALNINFSPYSQSKSTNKISATPKQNLKHQFSTYERQETRSISPMFSNPHKQSVEIERKRPIIESRQQDLLEINATANQSMSFQSIRNGQRPISIPFTPAESHNDDDQQISERSNADMSFENKKLNYNNRDTSDYAVQDRKKQIQPSNTIKGLVKALGEQVALDEAFRNNKIWFTSQNSEKKWAQIKKELQNIGVNISESMLKDTFSLEESQNNPFFSVSDSKCTIQSLAQSYLQGQSHWDQKINRKFRRADLEKEGLNSQKIDYDRKGFIEVEDLVRFLNLQSGTFFRLRDVSLIFRRITKNSQMQFSDFLEAVSA